MQHRPHPTKTLAVLGVVCVGLLAATAHALPLPEPSQERALVRDLLRIVAVKKRIGWVLDDIAIDDMLPDAMQSACQVSAAQRSGALGFLQERIVEEGGNLAEAYRRAGRDRDAVETLETWTRARLLLQRAHSWAAAGRCPYWLELEDEFSDRQSFAHKWVIGIETGGRAYLQSEGGELGGGGGGEGRLVFGRGLSERYSVLGTLGIGGSGRFTDLQVGERVDVPVLLLLGSTQMILRIHDLGIHYDLEAGPVGYFSQLSGELQIGGRIGVGVGSTLLRVQELLPGVSVSLVYDYLPSKGHLPRVHQLGVGIKAALSLNL